MAQTSSALTKVTDRVIDNNQALQTFRSEFAQVANLIFPDSYNFGPSPAHKVTATVIQIDTSDGNGNRDIYKTDSGTYALHLSALNRFAQAAGLSIIDSRILERQIDDKNQVVLISHQVKWRMKSVDGSIKEGVATGKYDYYNDLATKSPGQVKSRRKHAEALAESNAITRAINKGIGNLPQSFTLEELKKPFIVPCVIEDKKALLQGLPQEVQQHILALNAAKAYGVMDKMFRAAMQIEAPTGAPSAPTPPAAEPPADNSNIQDAQYTMAEPSKEEKNHILAEEFRGTTQKERTEKILNLCKIKGKKNNNNTEITAVQVEKADLNRQIAFIEELLNMNDIEEDLPL